MIRIAVLLLISLLVSCGDEGISPMEENTVESSRVNKPFPIYSTDEDDKHEQHSTNKADSRTQAPYDESASPK